MSRWVLKPHDQSGGSVGCGPIFWAVFLLVALTCGFLAATDNGVFVKLQEYLDAHWIKELWSNGE